MAVLSGTKDELHIDGDPPVVVRVHGMTTTVETQARHMSIGGSKLSDPRPDMRVQGAVYGLDARLLLVLAVSPDPVLDMCVVMADVSVHGRFHLTNVERTPHGVLCFALRSVGPIKTVRRPDGP